MSLIFHIGFLLKMIWAKVINLVKISSKGGPSVFCAFLNEKTLDYLFDNQAVVGFVPPQYFDVKKPFE
jgi:hypothetical protein